MKVQEAMMTLRKTFNHWKLETHGCEICFNKSGGDLITCPKCNKQVCEHCAKKISKIDSKCPFCRNRFKMRKTTREDINHFADEIYNRLSERIEIGTHPCLQSSLDRWYVERWGSFEQGRRDENIYDVFEEFIKEMEKEPTPWSLAMEVEGEMDFYVRKIIAHLYYCNSVSDFSPEFWKEKIDEIIESIDKILEKLDTNILYKGLRICCFREIVAFKSKVMEIYSQYQRCLDSYRRYDRQTKKPTYHYKWRKYVQTTIKELYDNYMNDNLEFYEQYVHIDAYERNRHVVCF